MQNADAQYDVVIVGAGFAGMYLLHRCRQLGLSARVWEKAAGVGGVWYWNRYPGARCDVESMQYCYQFDAKLQQEWNWSERYSAQPEILQYAQHVAERFNLLSGIDFEHTVKHARFDSEHSNWTLTATNQKTLTANYLIMATGCLSQPNWPVLDGYDDFAGQIYHTALWPHEGVDFSGKNVAVIGTGSSGIQSIPHIAADAKKVTIFQRTPNYSVPAQNAPLDPKQAAIVKNNYVQLRKSASEKHNAIDGNYSSQSALSVSDKEREAEYEKRWAHGGLTFLGAYGDVLKDKESNDTMVEFVHAKINSIVKDDNVAKLLMPNNIIGGKRMCVDTNYYATYNRENVALIDLKTQAIEQLNAKGVQTAQAQYDADIIVIATGFDAMTGALNQMDIQGRSGTSLSTKWIEGPSSYLGLAMHDYPNLFTVNGPGSPSVLTNMLPSIEHHVEWITNCIASVKQKGFSTIEAEQSAEQSWWQHVQAVANTGLKQSTQSWYTGANIKGKVNVFMPYLGGFPQYTKKCREVEEKSYDGFLMSK